MFYNIKKNSCSERMCLKNERNDKDDMFKCKSAYSRGEQDQSDRPQEKGQPYYAEACRRSNADIHYSSHVLWRKRVRVGDTCANGFCRSIFKAEAYGFRDI